MKVKKIYPYKKIYGFKLLSPMELSQMTPEDLKEHKTIAERIKMGFFFRNRNAVTLNKTNLKKITREHTKFEIILFYINSIEYLIKIKKTNPSSL